MKIAGLKIVVFAGQQLLGFVRQRGKSYVATESSGHELGAFSSISEAVDAIAETVRNAHA
jgi:hypothetical protein